MNHHLRGRRYIAYARCASAHGAEPKLREQLRLIRGFGSGLGMRCVDEVRLAGVSGVHPVFRPDLRALVARRRERGDFEVLIVEDHARLTRAGLQALSEIEAEFERGGVRIVYLTEMALLAGTIGRDGQHNPPAGDSEGHRGR